MAIGNNNEGFDPEMTGSLENPVSVDSLVSEALNAIDQGVDRKYASLALAGQFARKRFFA